MQTCTTNHNGGEYFRVTVQDNESDADADADTKQVKVYDLHHYPGFDLTTTENGQTRVTRRSDSAIEQDYPTEPTLFAEYTCDRVFEGISPDCPTTRFSGGHGCNGYSVLIHEKDAEPLDYLFIHTSVNLFKAEAPITEFFSVVGNNDVPYIYAVDTSGKHYLFTENVTLESYQPDTSDEKHEVYDHYYDGATIVSPRGYYGTPFAFEGKTITACYYGDRKFGLSYDPKRAQFDSMVERHGDARIEYDDGTISPLDNATYNRILDALAEERGFGALNLTKIDRPESGELEN